MNLRTLSLVSLLAFTSIGCLPAAPANSTAGKLEWLDKHVAEPDA